MFFEVLFGFSSGFPKEIITMTQMGRGMPHPGCPIGQIFDLSVCRHSCYYRLLKEIKIQIQTKLGYNDVISVRLEERDKLMSALADL